MRRRSLSEGKINKNFNENYNSRAAVLFCMLTFIVLLIVGKLIYLQLTPVEDRYRKLSAEQNINTVSIDAERGRVLDTNRETLADSVVPNNLYVNATCLDDQAKSNLVDSLSKSLSMKSEELRKILEKEKTVLVRPSLSRTEIDSIKKLPINNQEFISVVPEKKRYYPDKEMLSQVLGSTNINNGGVAGLENFYNSKLKGKPNKRILNSSVNRSIDLSDDSSVIIDPENGYDLETTTDITIQGFVEDSLKDIESNFKPRSTTIIVMNPNSEDVLGMGSYPNFNPNDPRKPLLKEQLDELNNLKKKNDEDKISKFYFNMWKNKATS